MKAALFDCDGTMLDSMPMWLNLATDVLASYGVKLPREVERQTACMSYLDASKFYADYFFEGEHVEALRRSFSDHLYHAYHDELCLKPGVRELLDALHARGIPMAVASSTDESLLLNCFDRLNLRGYFKFIQTVDNSGHSKDSDAYFDLAARSFGMAPGEIVLFDDALYALERARRCGFVTVAVEDITNEDQMEEIRTAGDYFVSHADQVDVEALFD